MSDFKFDPDKYEGHTEGPYFKQHVDYLGVEYCELFENTGKTMIAKIYSKDDTDLFADAPLLLKRCRELEGANKKLSYELEGVLSDYEHDKSFDEVGYNTVKRVAQALKAQEKEDE